MPQSDIGFLILAMSHESLRLTSSSLENLNLPQECDLKDQADLYALQGL